MVTSYDREYKATKLIKQGKAVLHPPFEELADWIASTWSVTVLNVIYDHIDVPQKRPRLQVIVEHSRHLETFRDGYNFDAAKQQAIASRFTEIVNRGNGTHYRVDRLLVVFAAFAPLAREEADDHITDAEVSALQGRIANPQLWTIHRCFGRVVFMFFTEEQKRTHARERFPEKYANMYFEVLQQHDEFKYLNRSRFAVEFDSKENFDNRYAGSWFYYDR